MLTLLDHSLTVSSDWDHPMTWVYLAGERKTGKTIKIGKTTQATVRQRLKSVNGAQMNDEEYVLLAAVRGDGTAESALHDYFKDYRQARGSHTEYFDAEPALIEYVLWLRTQHFVSINDVDVERLVLKEDRNHWIARPDRRVPPPPDDEDALFSRHLQTQGGLAGTAWAWMPDPLASFQDYFTPPDLVRRAWDAMDGIDLDAASHFLANRDLWSAGVEIPDYYTAGRSAMDHPWKERVWLNPPYGENREWFQRIAHEMEVGHVRQLCMLSPMYAFNTKQALPYMAKAEGMVVLSPTPKFKNPADPAATGINHPHAIVYWGDRCREFFAAFDGVGIPCELVLGRIS